MASTMWKIFAVLFTFIPLIFTASLPAGHSIQNRAPGVGLTVSEMVFRGTIHGVEVQLNGTAQSIYGQFTTLYPKVVAAHKNETSNMANLNKRGGKVLPPLCNVQNWGSCSVGAIREGEDFLRTMKGSCEVGGGPGNCTRISCSYDSAIYLCNDNPYAIHPDCGYLASYAEDIIDHCESFWGKRWHVTGQEFDTDNYNIVVKGESC